MAVDITPSTLLEFAKTIDSEPQPMSKTRMATVTRIGDDGTPYVTFPDGTETPLAGTVSTLKVGDSVMVSMQSGKLRANANVSDPAASTERMTRTETTALAAAKAADAASIAADAAEYDAQRAHEAADDAQASANSALASAANASEYASRALGNLSTVQSVSETLTWITQHGTMALTTDTALDPTHVYFMQDAEGDYVVGNTHYSIVAEPVASQLSSYYVLTIDESLNNYVGTHLAVTDEGLWVIPAASGGYKILIATGSGTTYTTAGTYIIDSGGTTVAFFGASVTIGDTAHPHITITNTALTMYGLLNADVIDLDTLAQQYYNPLRRNDGTAFGLLARIGKFNISDRGAYWEYELPNHAARLPFVITDGVVRIGDEYTSNILMDYHSMQLVDKDGNSYFHVSDLMDSRGYATIFFVGNGTKTYFESAEYWADMNASPAYLYVKVDGTTVISGSWSGSTASVQAGGLYFNTAPANGAVIEVYWPISPFNTSPKAYTIGTRLENSAIGAFSTAVGLDSVASGERSYAENGGQAKGYRSHAEGDGVASGGLSHAEGSGKANGTKSHAEGGSTVHDAASYSHAEGTSTVYGSFSHGEGGYTTVDGAYAHAEGYGTRAYEDYSHAQNLCTTAYSEAQTAIGKYNVDDANDTYAFIVGNGTADNARSNAAALKWDGTLELAKALPVASGGTGSTSVAETYSGVVSAGTNMQVVSQYAAVWGKVVMLYVCLKPSAAISASATIATVASSYRPIHEVFLLGATADHDASVESGGALKTRAALTSGTNYYFTGTYLIA